MALTNFRSLSYLAQVSILTHMDANQRIHFAISSSKIRTTDQRIPLKIRTLILNPLEIQLNGQHYEIDYNRKYHIPQKNKVQQRPIIYNVERLLFPYAEYQPRNDSIERLLRKEKSLEADLKKLEDKMRQFWVNGFEKLGNVSNEDVEKCAEELLEVKVELGLVRPMEYTDYIQFLHSGKSEYLEYTRPTRYAMEYFIYRVFSHRAIVHVDDLKIEIPSLELEKQPRKVCGLKIPPTIEMIMNSLSKEAEKVTKSTIFMG